MQFASQEKRGSGELPIVELFWQNWVVMECDNEVFLYTQLALWLMLLTPQLQVSIQALVITFHDHPVLGAGQNNSTIGSSLFSHEGLPREIMHNQGVNVNSRREGLEPGLA